MTNEGTIKRIVNKTFTFEDVNSFSNLIIIFEIIKINGAIQNLIFEIFSKYVNMADINAL